MRPRAALLAAALLAWPAGGVAAQSAEEVQQIIYDRAAAHGQSGAGMERLARCESTLNPNAVGDRGHSVGLFQIHDRGLLGLFLEWGYTDRSDPWQAADFTATAIARGLGSHWTCWGRSR